MLPEHTPLALNLSTLQLQGASLRVDVTDAESRLLQCLIAAQGNRMDGEALLSKLALPADTAGKNALGVRVVRLRKKLLAAGAGEPTIKSIRNGGYQLCVPVVAQRSGGQVQPLSPTNDSRP
jgi:DNA-binding response OmpR family regulator